MSRAIASMDNRDSRRQLWQALEALGPDGRRAEVSRLAGLLLPGRSAVVGEPTSAEAVQMLAMLASEAGVSMERLATAVEASVRGVARG